MGDLAALVVQARDGDAEAFAAVVRHFQDMAVGYGYSLLRDLNQAEDAAQEAFLEAYLCLPQLREPAAFPGWFRRIVFKQCDRLTRGKALPIVSLDTVQERSSKQPNQVEEMEQREVKDQVWAAIEMLPESQRTVVLLYYLSGYSQQEVSAFLDVPVTTVKKRLFSARRRLREMLMDVVGDTLRERRPSRDESFAAGVLQMLVAARAGDVARIKELLQENPRLLTARDWLGNSALIMAANSGHQAVVELLFNAGVQPDIYEAAAIGDTERVEDLLAEDPLRLNSYSAEGATPLALAAHFGHLETALFLIERGADLNAVALDPMRVTALHAALFGRQIETARMLIEPGGVVQRAPTSSWPAGWSALHYAAGFGFLELIEQLLARGAYVGALDEDGRTPLKVAIEEDQIEAADLLSRVKPRQ